MASLTRWTWDWVNSGSWWWTGRPGVLWFMGSQRVGHDWATELTELNWSPSSYGRTQRYCYVYFLRMNQLPALRLQYCSLTASPFYSSSPLPLSWQVTVWICPLELKEGQEQLNWTELNRKADEAYFLQAKSRGQGSDLYWEGPTGSFSVSVPSRELLS